ncbi:membrane protein [Microbispora rosea subsp. aerata]|nr:hemolysin family protein [Microbispora rosea]GGO13224.1 membrane protein [Microbispora rosea subsp. aerata]GIH58473.1 membrane protein [Microbispora rosea subsp. aerata]GLJ85201.1 membrane protein [Microbispora rosea subsp. aerata]
MSAALGLLAVLLLTLATGFFVAQEFAFVAADRGILREQASAGDAAARRALDITGRLSFMLSGAQLGITVTTLLVGFIAEPAIADLLRGPLGAAGLPGSAVPGVAVALGIAIATVVQMILGELAPKNLGIARPDDVAKFLSRPTHVYLAVAGPVIRLFDAAATRLVRLAGIEPVEELEHGATPEELSRIVSESAAAGELPPRLADILERALDFGDRTAEDVMVPRPRVVSLRAESPITEFLDALRTHGHSRYPVLGTDADDVVGVAGLPEYLKAGSPAEGIVGGIVRAPLLVPATLPLPELLRRMTAAGETFTCVIDEYGGLAGVVTLEDLAEELVGELVDENDPEPLGVVWRGDRVWDVPGTLRLDEVERATRVRLPESEDYETVAGLVLALLGRMAEPGDRVVSPLVPEPHLFDDEEDAPERAMLTVLSVRRRVPEWVRVSTEASALTSIETPAEDEKRPERERARVAARRPGGADYAAELFSALFQGRSA